MERFYFWSFVGVTSAVLTHGLINPRRFFEYPYFMASIFAVFILPQAVSLLRFPGAAPPDAVGAVILMTCLCLGMCLLGYLAPPSRWIARHGATPVDLRRLFHAAVAFVAAGYFFNFLISRMTAEETGGTMWTGRVTIYGFFAQLVYPGLAISLAAALRGGGLIPWLVAGLGAWIPIQSIVFAGRREQMALFALTIALTLFYQRRWVPPRLAVTCVLVFTLLAIPATGTYRGLMAEQDYEAVKKIDLVGNFSRFFREESILELRNAAMIMDVTSSLGTYEYGSGYWDQLVFRFVPAQLLGKEFKERLMFQPTEQQLEDELQTKGFQMSVGATITGMGDSFQQFGYLGCLFFAVLAVIFRSLWLTSLLPQAVFAQLLYIQTATAAMRAVTHQTVDYLPGLLYNVVFLGMAVWYARRTPSTGQGNSNGGGDLSPAFREGRSSV